MSRYYYEAVDGQGRRTPGILDCDSVERLHQFVDARGQTLVSYSLRPPTESKRGRKSLSRGRVTAAERGAFARQMARLLESACPMDRALTLVRGMARTQAMDRTLETIRMEVQQGSTLSASMKSHPDVFPALFVASVLAGETGGFLAAALTKLAQFEQDQERIRAKIFQSLMYPVVMLIITCVCLGVVFTFVVPTMVAIFDKSNMDLPAPTKVLIFLSDHFPWIAAGLAAIVAALWFARRLNLSRSGGKEAEDRFLLSLPLAGRLTTTVMTGRFGRIMALLLGGGVALTRALEITREAFPPGLFRKELDLVREQVTGGEALSRAIELSPVFPDQLAGESRFGEETGSLPKVLENLADEYERSAEAALEQLVSLIEPLIIVVMGGVMGFIVISVFLPMVTMVNKTE